MTSGPSRIGKGCSYGIQIRQLYASFPYSVNLNRHNEYRFDLSNEFRVRALFRAVQPGLVTHTAFRLSSPRPGAGGAASTDPARI